MSHLSVRVSEVHQRVSKARTVVSKGLKVGAPYP